MGPSSPSGSDAFSPSTSALPTTTCRDFLGNYQTAMAEFPEAKFHTYGKTARKGRKMGHITLLGEDADQLLERGRAARSALYGEASLD